MRRFRVIITTLLFTLIPSILFFGLSSGLELSQRKLSKNIEFADGKAEDIYESLQLLGMEEEHLQMLTSKEVSLYADVIKMLKNSDTLEANGGSVKTTLYNIFFKGENSFDKIRILCFYQWLTPPLSAGRACFKIVLPNNNFNVVKSSANNLSALNIIEKTIDDTPFLYSVSYKKFVPEILSDETGVANVFPFIGKQDGWLAFDVSLKSPSVDDIYAIKADFFLNNKNLFYSSPERSVKAKPSAWKINASVNFIFNYKE